MGKLKLIVIGLFLALIVAAYMYKQAGGKAEYAASKVKTSVAWSIDEIVLHKEEKISFVIQGKDGEGARGLNDQEQQELRVIVVSPNMNEYVETQPKFLGNGAFTFFYTFNEAGEYGIFLYRKNYQSQQSFSSAKVQAGEKAENKVNLQADALLTTKIGQHESILRFDALQAGGEETITFQFPTYKDKQLFHSATGEPSSFLLVHEDKTALVYAAAEDSKEDRLSFSVVFPTEGLYKIWGTFYIKGREYKQSFTVQVGKKD